MKDFPNELSHFWVWMLLGEVIQKRINLGRSSGKFHKTQANFFVS